MLSSHLPKVAKLGFWFQKICNVLKRMQQQFFTFFRLAKFPFLGLRSIFLEFFLTKFVFCFKFIEKEIAQISQISFSGSEKHFFGIFFDKICFLIQISI